MDHALYQSFQQVVATWPFDSSAALDSHLTILRTVLPEILLDVKFCRDWIQ